jgi:hypothetical protein
MRGYPTLHIKQIKVNKCTTFHSPNRVFKNEHNSYPTKSETVTSLQLSNIHLALT